MTATRDGFFLTRTDQGKWATIYGIESAWQVPEEIEEKYLFDSREEAEHYANANYTLFGILLDPALEEEQ